jgi:quercetin 2,3-dioxygenase
MRITSFFLTQINIYILINYLLALPNFYTMSTNNSRRSFLGKLGLGLASSLGLSNSSIAKTLATSNNENMNTIIETKPMGFLWDTLDPFLFCAHHEDYFPKGNEDMGPVTSLAGRHLGDDFIIKDGFRMYHGTKVPGFPGHPHRGFETITIVRKGMVDHSDSMGASGRYGDGDVQWMTAGKGVQHAEMFPLINTDKENTLELFQVWLNLPKQNKMVEPHFKMLWGSQIPRHQHKDAQGNITDIEVIAGSINNSKAPAPPPNSWASNPVNEVMVLIIKMAPNAQYTLPKASKGINRKLYYYEGTQITIADTSIPKYHSIQVNADADIQIINGNDAASILVLQGKPLNEPVIQYGPFVMNTKEEIQQAFDDYHTTQFGGWPWSRTDNVHKRTEPRFAKHADGRFEKGV